MTGADWNVSLEELEKFMGPCHRLQSSWWSASSNKEYVGWYLGGCSLFSKTMSRDRFLTIMCFLWFNLKTECRRMYW